MVKKLTYSVKKIEDGFIATCDGNKRISVFSTSEDKLDEGINRAACMYAKAYPNDEHAVLLQNNSKMRLERSS